MQDNESREIFSVSQLNRNVRGLLEENFPLIWVEGEISNLACPASGHIYFSLKDEKAQVRSAMFRGRNRNLKFKPANGMHVLVRAQVSLYEGRGDFQLIIEQMEEAGEGALRRAFEELKIRLEKEGLFKTERKQELPVLPKCIGVITSPTGAAIQDILSILKRRFPAIPVIIYPTQVQGESAASQIVLSIQTANKRKECDVLLVSRGGGSLEDLWPFNEEKVARSVFASKIPIVSGVGHEIDFTITDFVADKRAPTPSAAAELISPNQNEWIKHITRHQKRMTLLTRQIIKEHFQLAQSLMKRLRHPKQIITEKMQRLDNIEANLVRIFNNNLERKQSHVNNLYLNIKQHDPLVLIKTLFEKNRTLSLKLNKSIQEKILITTHSIAKASCRLDTISPLGTLKRGYSVTTNLKTGKILRDSSEVKKGDKISTRLSSGSMESMVD